MYSSSLVPSALLDDIKTSTTCIFVFEILWLLRSSGVSDVGDAGIQWRSVTGGDIFRRSQGGNQVKECGSLYVSSYRMYALLGNNILKLNDYGKQQTSSLAW